MAKRKTIDPEVNGGVYVVAVSNGTPQSYVGEKGTITDVNRGVYSVLFNDGKTQCFLRHEIVDEREA